MQTPPPPKLSIYAQVLGAPSVEAATEIIFAPGGPIEAQGYEIRESQKKLALCAARRADSGGWALGEAPTGTGKGIAYLIPGVIAALRAEADKRAGKVKGVFPKLIVSTENIALQTQLITKDIPGVAALLGVDVRACLYKGRANYLCRRRLAEAALMGLQDLNVQRLMDWSREDGCSGDREDLDWDPGRAWGELSVQSKDCAGNKCRHFGKTHGEKTCFSQVARAGADEAHVIVMNHYMLALARPIPAVLLAVDECHSLEDCLRTSRAKRLSKGTARSLAARFKRVSSPQKAASMIQLPLETVVDLVEFWATQNNAKYQLKLDKGWSKGWDPSILDSLSTAAGMAISASKRAQDEEEEHFFKRLAEDILSAYDRAHTVMTGEPVPRLQGIAPGPWAIWAEIQEFRGEKRVTCMASPADVAPLVGNLQEDYPRAILTSATLAVEGGFTFARSALGLMDPGQPAQWHTRTLSSAGGGSTEVRERIRGEGPKEELILPSPYPLKTMGVLVVPAGAPDPKDYGRWKDWAPRMVAQVVKASKGRALILSSSRRMMDSYAMAVDHAGFDVRTQGDMGRTELIRWFKENTAGVLVATRSFFQGLDVSGESLSCLIIDRIPFSPPGDPLEDAVGALQVQRSGGTPFWARSFPKTCMTLTQGAGRLIRSQTDRGAIVCLDSRVVSGGMSRSLRAALPPFPVSRSVSDVQAVLEGKPLSVQPVRGVSIRRRRK